MGVVCELSSLDPGNFVPKASDFEQEQHKIMAMRAALAIGNL